MSLAIPGLRYVPGYIDDETHDRLLMAADSGPWLLLGDRRVQTYGYSYHHTKGVYRIGDLPSWVSDVAMGLWRDGLMPDIPDQMIVNEYEPGAGIGAHLDHAVFANAIVSVSLGSTCVMQFSQSRSEHDEHILLEPRSALVLSGDARHKWMHSIPARGSDVWMNRELPRSRRVSLTFRKTLPTSSAPPD
jgi:alkylated DNA repair dioxygenase AlkB